jgi:hypothetical protein
MNGIIFIWNLFLGHTRWMFHDNSQQDSIMDVCIELCTKFILIAAIGWFRMEGYCSPEMGARIAQPV